MKQSSVGNTEQLLFSTIAMCASIQVAMNQAEKISEENMKDPHHPSHNMAVMLRKFWGEAHKYNMISSHLVHGTALPNPENEAMHLARIRNNGD